MISWGQTLESVGSKDSDRATARSGLPTAASQPATAQRIGAEVALFFAVAIGFVLLLHTFVVEVRWIPSGSMLDPLHIHDRVAVSKISYRLHPPRRGDIVVFQPPPIAGDAEPPRRGLVARWVHSLGEGLAIVHPSTDDYIKRVIALPGERVAGRNGHVYVNGHRLLEPYLMTGATTSDFPPTEVPPGAVWLMGDNRPNSSDSRVFGPVAREKIVGRATFRIWPPWRVAFL